MPEEYFLQIVGPRVSPAAATWESGLPVTAGGTSEPFIVERGWVGPAGTYIEEWSIRREGKVLYRHPPAYIQVRGHQSVRRFQDTVRTPLVLEPGTYEIAFVVERYLMGSVTIQAAPLEELSVKPAPLPAPPPPPVAPRTAAARPGAPAPAPAGSPRPASSGEDPSLVRERVYKEELAKGSDPRVAEARAKSAEMRAKKAAAAPAPAPSDNGAPPPAPAPAPEPVPAAAAAASKEAPSPLVPGAPPDGGGFSPEQAAVVRTLVYNEAITKGLPVEVAEAQARSAEIRALRGVWWRPDW